MAWLPDALRSTGAEVDTVRCRPEQLDHLIAASPGYDVIHVHGMDALGTRAVKTAYGSEHPSAPWIALSPKGIPADADLPAAVLPPAIDTAAIPPQREPGDHLAFAFNGRDEYALGAAIATATKSERPLVVVLSEGQDISESCSAALGAGEETGWLSVDRLAADAFPESIANAAAYLAFSRESFDMGALTALATGTPIVAFTGSPTAEVIVHGESGYLFDVVDQAAMWLGYLDELSSAKARSRARLVFDAEASALRHLALYDRLATGADAPAPQLRSPAGLPAGETSSDDAERGPALVG